MRCASSSPPPPPRSPDPEFVGHTHHTVAVVATGDTKNDLHVNAYEQAIAGDTKGRLPRAIAPAPASTQVVVASAGRAKPAVAGDGSTTAGRSPPSSRPASSPSSRSPPPAR